MINFYFSINSLSSKLKVSKKKFSWKTFGLVFILFLNGCSILPTEDISNRSYNWNETRTHLIALKNWSLFGKLGIRTENESFTAAINNWHQNDEQFEIDISSTFFGLGASKLYGNADFLSIIQSGEDPVSSSEPDRLIESSLGFPLPLTYLQYWIKGLPAEGVSYSQTFNDQGLTASIEQDNWLLSYSNYHTEYPAPLPGKIKIQRDDIRIIVAVKEWTLP